LGEVDEFDGHGRHVSDVEALSDADRPLDWKHVAALAAGEDGSRPRAAPGRGAHPDRAETAAQPAGQVTYLLSVAGGKAPEGPALGTPGVPQPQLSVKGHLHGLSLPHQVRTAGLP